MKKEPKIRCRYCGKIIDQNGSRGQDTVTGEYFHIECFIDSEPDGQSIVERSLVLANKALEERAKKKSQH